MIARFPRRRASIATGRTPLTARTAPFKRELADETEIVEDVRLDFLRGRDHAERDRQIETRPFFFNVGRREIDRRPPARPKIAAVADRGGDAIAAFLHRRIGQPDDDDLRIPAAGVDLDLDFVGIDSVNGSGVNFGEHEGRVWQKSKSIG